MGRAKLRLEPIMEENKRNTTYRNRKDGIIKKANELSCLCDVNAAIIVYPPGSNEPEIWPQNPNQIKNMIGSYKEEKNENRKKTYDLNDYFEDRKRKIEDELVRARERNVEAKYPTWFNDLNGLSEGHLKQFAIELENKKNAVKAHLEHKKSNLKNVEIDNNQPSSSHFVGSLDQVEAAVNNVDLMSQVLEWVDMPDLQMPFENNQPSNPDLLMSQVIGRFDDMLPDLQMPYGFELENNQQANNNSVGSHPSLDQGGSGSMMSRDFGWFNDAPTTWSVPERSGFGYPVFGCDVVYDQNWNRCPRQTLEQCGPMPEGQPRQFAIRLENKKNAVKAHLESKKRKFNVQTLSGFERVKNQPYNHYVGSYSSLDQVQAFDDNMMSQVPDQWFDDIMLDVPMPLGFELENNQPSNQYVGASPSLNQCGSMMSHNLGWFSDASTVSSINPLKPEVGGFGYPVFEGDVVYDNSKPCPCQPFEQCGPILEELALQDSHVNYDGVGDGLGDS